MQELFNLCWENEGFELTVNLESQTLVNPLQGEWCFQMESSHRKALLQGLDEIGLTLERAQTIRAFETNRRAREPWLFSE